MSRLYTDQDRIDEQTMRIENPNVVGSGYIQFAPQRPFERPVQMQPPTVAHLDHPQEYQNYSQAPQPAPRPAQALSSVGDTSQANGHIRGPNAPVPNANTATKPYNAYQPLPSASRPVTQQTQRHQEQQAGRPVQHYAAATSATSRTPQQQQAAQRQYVPVQLTTRANSQQAQQMYAQTKQNAAPNGFTPVSQARTAPSTNAAPRPAAAPAPAAAVSAQANIAKPADDADGGIDTSQMSKAQKQRLRKKLREGRA